MVSNHSSTDLQLLKSGMLLFIKGLFSLKWEQLGWGGAHEMYLWNAASRKSIWVKMIEKVGKRVAVDLTGLGRLIQGWNPYFFPSTLPAHLDMHRQLDRTCAPSCAIYTSPIVKAEAFFFWFTADQCQYSTEVFYLTANTSIWDELIGKRTLSQPVVFPATHMKLSRQLCETFNADDIWHRQSAFVR